MVRHWRIPAGDGLKSQVSAIMMKKRNTRTPEFNNRRTTIYYGAQISVAFVMFALSYYFLSKDLFYVNPDDFNYDYAPKNCSSMVNGHCADEDGGGWSYRNGKGCLYVEYTPEANSAPRDHRLVSGLPTIFPDVKSVMDFGGGPGVYLTGFRNAGISKLVTVEPYPLEECLFKSVTQDTRSWVNTPMKKLPSNEFDLVMTIEVLEHIPVAYHKKLIQSLAEATSKWLFFSAAQPGQDGEGHVGPSMKTRDQWIGEIQEWTSNQLLVDESMSKMVYGVAPDGIIKENSVVFRKAVAG